MANKSFATKEQYLAFRETFKKASKERKLTSYDMLLFALLRGKPVDYGFAPITNTRRLACQCNGDQWFFHKRRVEGLKWTVQTDSSVSHSARVSINKQFGDTITREAWDYLRGLFNAPIYNNEGR